uniref:NADH-ubiquinone oxidoreductase chain 2 n=1 Tax=Metacrangonyx repens TaxID=1199184 RepID=K7ZVN6_9CRUS|nr:NADH dehydrogenase subunit 2 [Metacrangonyx repens]CCI69407.1 NADH dehydrogenase subunit 2 [Metacrangonyx repens]
MFFHPSFVLFCFFLIFSIIMMVCMNSWFLIWFFIEMNLLSFIPLIMLKKSKYSIESGLKYFFIQTFSSILIFIGVLSMFMNFDMYYFLFISGLSIKLGFVPFHQWIVNIVEGLTWPLVGILLTIQKVGPFILFNYMYININEVMNYMVYIISLLCAMIGSLGGLFTSSLRKIMVFSSISHNSWMILGVVSSIYIWMIYFFFYSFILFSVLYILEKFLMNNLSHMFLKLNFFISLSLGISLLSIGGMPPLTGFIPKFVMIKEFTMNYNIFLLVYLLLGAFISLFFYARIFVFNFIMLMHKNMFLSKSNNGAKISLFINAMGLFMIPIVLMIL